MTDSPRYAADLLHDPEKLSAKEALRKSVILTSLENIIKFDDCPQFVVLAQRRVVRLLSEERRP